MLSKGSNNALVRVNLPKLSATNVFGSTMDLSKPAPANSNVPSLELQDSPKQPVVVPANSTVDARTAVEPMVSASDWAPRTRSILTKPRGRFKYLGPESYERISPIKGALRNFLEFVNIIAVSSRYFLQRYQPIAVKFGGRALRRVFSRSVTVARATPLAFDTLEFAKLR
jgi:hypothetical protein